MKPSPGKWKDDPIFSSTAPKVVLLGDSVLDNFFWLLDPKLPLSVVLRQSLQGYGLGETQTKGKKDGMRDKEAEKEEKEEGGRESPKEEKNEEKNEDKIVNWEVVNLAVDESTTEELELKTITPYWSRRYATAKSTLDYKRTEDGRYYIWSDNTFRPLDTLSMLSNVKYVILSVGGNDVYLNPDVATRLQVSLRPRFRHLRKMVARELAERYEHIVETLKAVVPEASIVSVIPYHPAYSFSMHGFSTGFRWFTATTLQKWFLSSLVTPIAQAILRVALRHNLSVIDLSHSLDPRDDSWYGTGGWGRKNCFGVGFSGVEPSNKSNTLIAKLILEAMNPKKTNKSRGPKYFQASPKDKLGTGSLTEAWINAFRFG